MDKHRFLITGTIVVLVLLLGTLLFYQPILVDSAKADQPTKTPAMINGLNTTSLSGLVDMLKKDPKAGQTTFYSKSWWQHGMRSFTGFSGYKIDGKMYHEKTRNFVLLGDEGVELSGTDAAPGAVEEMMYALGTCVIAAANANAAFMGVNLTRLEAAIESDLDLHGLFALDKNVRPGVKNLRIKFTIAGDADEETLRKIAMSGYQYSPVSETVRNGVSVAATPEITVVSHSGAQQATTAPAMVNGLNTTSLSGLVDMLKKDPKAGQTTFYSKSWWQHGMRSFTGFSGYKIDGKMHHEKNRDFVLLGDEGVELSGTDAAPGAVEEMMYAMGTCVIAAANANAAFMGVSLTRLEVALESDLDLHGLFALDKNVRPGVKNLRTKFTIAGDADEETLKKIAMLGYQYSPVSETVRNGVSVASTPEITVVK